MRDERPDTVDSLWAEYERANDRRKDGFGSAPEVAVTYSSILSRLFPLARVAAGAGDPQGDRPTIWQGCPCTYTTPCDPHCTCVAPFSSRGCTRCCKYGSLEQRHAQAERLAFFTTVTLGAGDRPPAPSEAMILAAFRVFWGKEPEYESLGDVEGKALCARDEERWEELRDTLQAALGAAPREASAAAIEVALEVLTLPASMYWQSGEEKIRPPRHDLGIALRAAYAVDSGAVRSTPREGLTVPRLAALIEQYFESGQSPFPDPQTRVSDRLAAWLLPRLGAASPAAAPPQEEP